ncbi:MAG TPA: HAD family phosphatase [Planctomycetota bacterium]|nr:HAD family phosphatase [Planctomycetota bacterium]
MGKSRGRKGGGKGAAAAPAPASPLATLLADARALVFDLDGVLVSTDKLKYESYRRALDRLGTDLSFKFYKTLIGLSRMATCQAIVEHCRLKVSAKELADLREAEHPGVFAERGVEVIPAARKLLAVLPRDRYKLALVSSSTRDRVTAALGVLDFDFDSVVSGEGVQPKPAPDIYLKSFKELGIRAVEAVVFEDSENGVAAAAAAGAHCVAVPAEVTQGQDFSEADLRIASLNEVRELLR